MTELWNHDSELEGFPDVPVTRIDPFDLQSAAPSHLTSELHDWCSDYGSNLLVLSGPFGSGKTHGIGRLIASYDASPFDYDRVSDLSVLKCGSPSRIVVIDNFDAVNRLSSRRIEEPDFRDIADLASSHRVVVATRRSVGDKFDEMIRQLRSEDRLSKIGFVRPVVLHLLPWRLDELALCSASRCSSENHMQAVIDYLSNIVVSDTERLRRPLLFKMLMRLAAKHGVLNKSLTLSNLYMEYCEIALATDYDLNRSQISPMVKSAILSNLAYDIFTGTEQSDHFFSSPLSLTVDRVSERVYEELMKARILRQRATVDTYDWTQDFLSTNHIFHVMPSANPSRFVMAQYGFLHPSYYEYFVSLAICQRISNGHALQLNVEQFSVATIDSLAFAFVKEIGGVELKGGIRRIVARPRLGVVDRLVLLYFMEDEEDFLDILQGVPQDYMRQLAELEQTVASFFLKKMIRYQLVVAGEYDPHEYVLQVERFEDSFGLEAEMRLHSSERAATLQLLARLQNPALKRAWPITVHRLGQLGDASAISALEALSVDAAESERTDLLRVIDEINLRLGGAI